MKQNLIHRAALITLAMLAFSLPFETELLQWSDGSLRVTNLEVALGLLLVLTLLLRLREGQSANVWYPSSWLVLWGLLAISLFLSAVLAPELHQNAIKASIRMLSGMALALATPQLVRQRDHFLLVVGTLLLGAFLSISGGMLELILGTALAWFDPFRIVPTSVGPFMRLTASFDHANQAAMYIEGALPLLVAATWAIGKAGRRLHLALGALAILVFLQAAILTYSRASFVTLILSSLTVAFLLVWRRPVSGRHPAFLWAGVAPLVLLLLAINAVFNPVVRLRLQSEGDNEWYNLTFDVPEMLEVSAGSTVTATVHVQNEGLLTWSERDQIRLGGHWFLEGDDRSLSLEPRWLLGESVSPGQATTIQVPLRAPTLPGDYRFQWDLVHERVTWFSGKNGDRTFTRVTVQEGENGPSVTDFKSNSGGGEIVDPPPDISPIPSRRVLWEIALRQFSKHPLTGIGLDNFRLTYGRALHYESWNKTIHTNNWYVELLASLGVLGIPFFLWVSLLGFGLIRALRQPEANVWVAGLAAGITAFLIHGLLDFFLLFYGTALLFWLLVGLWVAQIGRPTLLKTDRND